MHTFTRLKAAMTLAACFSFPIIQAQNTFPTSGNVGISTTNPGATLEVGRGTSEGGTAIFKGTTHFSHFNYSTVESTYIRGGKTGASVLLNDSHNGNVILANGGGNVGVGTDVLGSYKLAVAGKIGAWGEVRVFASGTAFPDYVFASTYRLRPLSEVEAYIQQNHRLPEVPSAKEVIEKGMGLVEMQTLAVKKIEELTLYLIEVNRQIGILKQKNTELEAQLKRLEKQSLAKKPR